MSAAKGSQKWPQVLLNQRPDILAREIGGVLPEFSSCSCTWLSPIESRAVSHEG